MTADAMEERITAPPWLGRLARALRDGARARRPSHSMIHFSRQHRRRGVRWIAPLEILDRTDDTDELCSRERLVWRAGGKNPLEDELARRVARRDSERRRAQHPRVDTALQLHRAHHR